VAAANQENGVDVGGQHTVVQRDGLLEFEIGGIPDATHQKTRLYPPAEVDRQPGKLDSFHPLAPSGERLADHSQPDVVIKEPLLGGIGADGHVHFIEQVQCALHNVDVGIGDRIE